MHTHTLVTLVLLIQTLLFSFSATQQTDPVNAGKTLNACPQIPPVPFANVRCAAMLVECADSSCQAGERCCPTTPCGFSKCTNVGFSSDNNSQQPVAPPKPVRPVRPRPTGECPPVPKTPLMCTAVVMPPCDPTKCGNAQKCCFNGCHTVCTTVVPRPQIHPRPPRPQIHPRPPRPVAVPAGECPAIPAVEGPRMCTKILMPPCEQSNCGADEKCCFDGCHTRCTKVETQASITVPPVTLVLPPVATVPAAECPAIPAVEGPRMCTQVFLPPCDQSNCGADEKCCFDGCHTRCTKVGQVTAPVLPVLPPVVTVPPPVSTGECPAIPAVEGPRMCTRIFLPPCEQSNCGADEKCCFDGCHTRCTKVGQVTLPVLPPVVTVPPPVPTGACPAIPAVEGPRMCTRIFLPPCEQSKCGANEKCCFDGCHTRCTKVGGPVILPPKPRVPVVGQCPPAPRGLMCTMVMRPPCVESACGPNQKCCSNGCYSTCTTVSSNLAFAIGIDSDSQQQLPEQQDGQQLERQQEQQQGQQSEAATATTTATNNEAAPTWAIVLLAIGAIIIVITIVVIVQVQLVFSRRQLRY